MQHLIPEQQTDTQLVSQLAWDPHGLLPQLYFFIVMNLSFHPSMTQRVLGVNLALDALLPLEFSGVRCTNENINVGVQFCLRIGPQRAS